MDENQVRVGEVQFVVAAVDKDTAAIEHSTHGAIGKHGAAGEDVGELRHSVAMLRHAQGRSMPAGQGCFVILRESNDVWESIPDDAVGGAR